MAVPSGRRSQVGQVSVRKRAMPKLSGIAINMAMVALARADLGFAPTVSLEEGIEAEYRWLSSTPALR